MNPIDSLKERWSDLKVKDSDFPPQMRLKFDEVRKAGGDVDDAMRRFLADVESLDDSVGMILKRLDELGLRLKACHSDMFTSGGRLTKCSAISRISWPKSGRVCRKC